MYLSFRQLRNRTTSHRNPFLVAIVFVVASSSCAVEPEPGYWQTFEKAGKYARKGEWEEAERYERLAIEEIRSSPTAPE